MTELRSAKSCERENYAWTKARIGLLEVARSREWEKARLVSLGFADFALKLLYYAFSLHRFNLQSVEHAWRTKLKLHSILQSLH
jgi:hypothetical protein